MLLGGTFMMHLLEEAFIIIEWHSACAWVAMGAGWMVVWQKQRGKEKEGGGEGGGCSYLRMHTRIEGFSVCRMLWRQLGLLDGERGKVIGLALNLGQEGVVQPWECFLEKRRSR